MTDNELKLIELDKTVRENEIVRQINENRRNKNEAVRQTWEADTIKGFVDDLCDDGTVVELCTPVISDKIDEDLGAYQQEVARFADEVVELDARVSNLVAGDTQESGIVQVPLSLVGTFDNNCTIYRGTVDVQFSNEFTEVPFVNVQGVTTGAATQNTISIQANATDSSGFTIVVSELVKGIAASTPIYAKWVAWTSHIESPAEVVDARLGYDGTTYATAGDAIRNQIEDVYRRIEELEHRIADLS